MNRLETPKRLLCAHLCAHRARSEGAERRGVDGRDIRGRIQLTCRFDDGQRSSAVTELCEDGTAAVSIDVNTADIGEVPRALRVKFIMAVLVNYMGLFFVTQPTSSIRRLIAASSSSYFKSLD